MSIGRAAVPRQAFQSRNSCQWSHSSERLKLSSALATGLEQHHPARLNRLQTIFLRVLSTTRYLTGNLRLRQRPQHIRSSRSGPDHFERVVARMSWVWIRTSAAKKEIRASGKT